MRTTGLLRAELRRAAVALACAALSVALVAPAALGDVSGSGDNVQDGDNTAIVNQSGTAQSGDAIAGGQVVGVVVGPGGRATIDASNTATNASAESGDVRGSNDMGVFVGLDSVLGQQVVRGVANQLRSVGSGNSQSVLTANDLIGPAGPLGPVTDAAPAPDLGAVSHSGPVGPPGPVGPVMTDSSWTAPTDVLSTEAQPTGPPGPAGPGLVSD